MKLEMKQTKELLINFETHVQTNWSVIRMQVDSDHKDIVFCCLMSEYNGYRESQNHLHRSGFL